jgi:hypothetical protein
LDHDYKLFSDGRFFDIRGEEMREIELRLGDLGSKALQANNKLKKAIAKAIKGPISKQARKVVDAFGNPLPSL